MKLDLNKLSDLFNCNYGNSVIEVTGIETVSRYRRCKSSAQKRSNGRYITSGSMIWLNITTPDYVLEVDCGMGREGKRVERQVRGLVMT